MRNIVSLFILFPLLSLYGQDVFQQHASHPSVLQLNVSPQMFQMLSRFKVQTDDPSSQEFIEMIQSLRRFRLMSTKDSTIARAMEDWLTEQYTTTSLESILNLTEKGIRAQFGAVYGDKMDEVKRLVMYVKGLQDFVDKQENISLDTQTPLDFILLEIQGDIDLNQVASLTKLIDIPGVQYLDALEN